MIDYETEAMRIGDEIALLEDTLFSLKGYVFLMGAFTPIAADGLPTDDEEIPSAVECIRRGLEASYRKVEYALKKMIDSQSPKE